MPMNEVFIIEKMVVVGVWELISNIFYTDEKKALVDCLNLMSIMRKKDKNFTARVTKLEINKE